MYKISASPSRTQSCLKNSSKVFTEHGVEGLHEVLGFHRIMAATAARRF